MFRRTGNDERKLIEQYRDRVVRDAQNLNLDARTARKQGNEKLSELLIDASYGSVLEAAHIHRQLKN